MSNIYKISIIVPVYNVERYLRKCLDSIIAQTFSDWECICVDDGSPDNSGKILDEYAAKDKRFVIIHKENGGVSSARNAGLDMARGEYITFCDSDDWIEKETYEVAYMNAKKNNADIVTWQYQINDENKLLKDFIKKPRLLIINQDTNLPHWRNACWCLLISNNLIKNNEIRFPENICYGEDRHFTYCCYACAKKIWELPDLFYHYFENKNSVSQTEFNLKKLSDNISSLELTEYFFMQNNIKKLQASITESKIRIKESILLSLVPTNINMVRTTFPEVNIKCLFRVKKLTVIYWMIFFRFDFLVEFIIYLKNSRKK